MKGELSMSLGEKIKQRRRQLAFSQEKLAELVSVHSNTIRKWEKGNSSPSAEEVRSLAEALGVTTAFLYDENDTNNKPSFFKNSAYQDKTEIQNSIPSMAYWGSLVDNAERTAENGRNLQVIIGLVKTALNILENATNTQQETQEGCASACGYSIAGHLNI